MKQMFQISTRSKGNKNIVKGEKIPYEKPKEERKSMSGNSKMTKL